MNDALTNGRTVGCSFVLGPIFHCSFIVHMTMLCTNAGLFVMPSTQTSFNITSKLQCFALADA